MEEIFKIAGAIIISFGGSSVIILALSSWLGKVWANRILEEEKKKHTLEIENYKSKLQKGLELQKSINDKAIYISKVQYDKEFIIYVEIWEKLMDAIVHTKFLYPTLEDIPKDEEDRKKYQLEKYNEFIKKYNEYSKIIDKYAPFYQEKFYSSFLEIRKLCSQIGAIFKTYNIDRYYSLSLAGAGDINITAVEREKVYIKIPNEIDKESENLRKDIRIYLTNLQIIKN
jgi:hypothetical protein